VRMLGIALALLLAAPLGAMAQVRQRPQPDRAALERQIVQRVAEGASRELDLPAPARAELERLLLEGNARRREFAREALALRMELGAAARDPSTPDGEFERILGALRDLRRREYEQTVRDEDALAAILTPRQRAQVTLRLAMLQERIRDLMGARGGRLPHR
jgi:Spy/CpxP family protein refolding chaperone